MSSPLALALPWDWDWYRWLGDLNLVPGLTPHLAGVVCIAVSGVCGAIVGVERERRHKPAGLRTLILICVGSTIFTLASGLLSREFAAASSGSGWRPDPGRIAAQVVTGIGFLGAGAIMHARRTVVGLTTGASIWVVAAVGVLVGIGYAAAGLVLSLLIFLILTAARVLERGLEGPCSWRALRVRFRGDEVKGRLRLLSVLDDFNPSRYQWRSAPPPNARGQGQSGSFVDLRYCVSHAHHRAFLPELLALAEIDSIEEIEW